jgi:conjugal transfer/type IV secretion protein DotA/TraY
MFALTILANVSFIALGTGMPENAVGSGVIFLANWIMALVIAYMAWAFTFGGMLAVYVPLVPYLIYVFAAIGWFTGVIEAMVAAPFVALGILMPGGQSEIWGRAEPAMMLLLNTCLRPTLMVVGMMAGMLFASVVVSFVNAGFLGCMNSIAGTSPSMIETILFISAYSSIVITALNKCFALIYLLPEKVLTWIGGQAISYGEAESVAQVKGAVEQMAGTISGAAKGSAESSTAAAKSAGDANLAQRRKNSKDFTGGAGGK